MGLNGSNCYILFRIDNTSAVASINKICMDIAVHDISNYAISGKNWLIASHISVAKCRR